MTDQDKLIECYEQIGDLRQTLKEIAIIAGDLSHQGGPYGKFAAERISERALSARDRTKPNMETEYETAD